MRGVPNLPQVKMHFQQFTGGYAETPGKWTISSKLLKNCKNFEEIVGEGYADIVGYERFDGQAAPSETDYATMTIITDEGRVAVAGDTITGITSGATATVIASVGTPLTAYTICNISGTFVAESLMVELATAYGETDGTVTINDAATAALDAAAKNGAADALRALIAAVPGSGSILGVVKLAGVVYAFRNNVGGTAAALYKSTAAGWVGVSLGYELSFTSGGTTAIAEGDTITGATSTATATIARVVLESGSWAAGDASGRLIFASQSGTFQAENLNVGVATNLATIAGDSSAITLQPSGTYEFVISDFIPSQKRIYGVDGANRGFEFDGTTFVPIETGMATDTPNKVYVHKKHLFFAFDNSIQHSGIGEQYIWTPIAGAAELLVESNVTGFMVQPGGEGNAALAVFTRNKIYILYGSSSADWNMVALRDEIGAFDGSIQQAGDTIFMDDQGIRSLGTVQDFGNFSGETHSDHIKTWINTHKTKLNCSCIVRDKSQIRLFFSDSSALYITLKNRKIVSMMPCQFNDQVVCIWSGENTDGSESIYFGSTDGFVYQMEKGTSFDGDAIDAYMNLHWEHMGAPRLLKAFKRFVLDSESNGYAEFDVSWQVDYGSKNKAQPGDSTLTMDMETYNYDSLEWNTFEWDGGQFVPKRSSGSCGSGAAISVIIRKNSDQFTPVRHSGAIHHYIPRRIIR